MTRTQIYFLHNQIDYLRQRAFEENTSISEIIRKIVDNQVPKKTPKKNAGKWLLSIAKDAQNRGIKGPADLSSKIDEYLYGK